MGDQLREISALKSELKTFKASFEAQALRLKTVEGELAERVDDARQTKEALVAAEAENSCLSMERSELKDEIGRLQAETADLTALKAAGEERERKSEKVIEDLQSRFVEMERQKDEAVKEIEKVLGAVISEVQDEKEKVGVELAESRNKAEELGKWVSELKEMIQEMQSKIEDMEGAANAQDAEIHALRQQLQAEEQEVRVKEKQIAKLTADTKTLNELMTKAVESRQGMEVHLEAKGREVEEIKGGLRQAETKVAALERELSWKDGRLRAVEEDAQTKQLQLKRLEGQLVEVQQQVGVVQREKEAWMGRFWALEQEKTSLDAELYELSHQMLMKEREVQALQAAQGYGLDSD
ncbi:unnamed protein product [Closterium sp. Yama58-4]|nr:unnamed protein product [Closterium sp. Yama58-4]